MTALSAVGVVGAKVPLVPRCGGRPPRRMWLGPDLAGRLRERRGCSAADEPVVPLEPAVAPTLHGDDRQAQGKATAAASRPAGCCEEPARQLREIVNGNCKGGSYD